MPPSLPLISNRFNELLNESLYGPEYSHFKGIFLIFSQNLAVLLHFSGTFNKKRDAFNRYRKPKNRTKFSDNRPKINPSHPKGFSLTTHSFLIPGKITLYFLFSFSIFRHSILDIFLYFGYGWYCCFNLGRLSILVNYYAIFYYRYT